MCPLSRARAVAGSVAGRDCAHRGHCRLILDLSLMPPDGGSIVFETRAMQRQVPNWMLGFVNILTIVSADVDEGRAQHLTSEFEKLLAGGLPDGLLETRLLGDGQGHWAIHSLWRDRAALDAMRASLQPPAAPALFRRFAAEPTLVVMRVVADSADRA